MSKVAILPALYWFSGEPCFHSGYCRYARVSKRTDRNSIHVWFFKSPEDSTAIRNSVGSRFVGREYLDNNFQVVAPFASVFNPNRFGPVPDEPHIEFNISEARDYPGVVFEFHGGYGFRDPRHPYTVWLIGTHDADTFKQAKEWYPCSLLYEASNIECRTTNEWPAMTGSALAAFNSQF